MQRGGLNVGSIPRILVRLHKHFLLVVVRLVSSHFLLCKVEFVGELENTIDMDAADEEPVPEQGSSFLEQVHQWEYCAVDTCLEIASIGSSYCSECADDDTVGEEKEDLRV